MASLWASFSIYLLLKKSTDWNDNVLRHKSITCQLESCACRLGCVLTQWTTLCIYFVWKQREPVIHFIIILTYSHQYILKYVVHWERTGMKYAYTTKITLTYPKADNVGQNNFKCAHCDGREESHSPYRSAKYWEYCCSGFVLSKRKKEICSSSGKKE